MEIISMTCRNCGGKLQFNKDADQILCQFCGTEYVVSLNEGAVSIKALSEGIKKITVSTDKTASELALVRIRQEKESLIDLFGEIADSMDTSDGKLIINNEINLLQTGEIKFEPALFRENCEELIRRQERAVFKNNHYLNDLKKIHTELGVLEKRVAELENQEKYHLGIVNNN